VNFMQRASRMAGFMAALGLTACPAVLPVAGSVRFACHDDDDCVADSPCIDGS
jgi:hypothetical protein